MALSLQPNQAHLWYLPSEEPTSRWLGQAVDSLVSPAEFTQSRSFLTRQARDSYLMKRAFVRTVLSQYIDVDLQSWNFRANKYGKPEIASPAAGRSLRFSLASTNGLVTCAVALGRDIGIDAEMIDSTVETDAIADHFFAPTEAAALRALPPGEQRYRFFGFWTLKESYIKARGLGLSLSLEKFAFVAQKAERIEIVFDTSIVDEEGHVDDPRNWHFALLQPIKSHLIAVALGRLPTEEQVSWRAAIELIIKPLEIKSLKQQCAYGDVAFSS
jgi:4'-phosphopantetheinyl transferase